MSKIAMVPGGDRGHPSVVSWLRHLFADSVDNGPNLREALAEFGKWTIEIVKRAADAAGFVVLRAAGSSNEPWLGSIEIAAGKGFRGYDCQRQSVGLHRLSAVVRKEISLNRALPS